MVHADRIAALNARAATVNLNASEYARTVLFSRQMPPTVVDRSTLREVAVELTRVGNNLNQLARVANTTGQIRSETALQALLDQIAEAMARVIRL